MIEPMVLGSPHFKPWFISPITMVYSIYNQLVTGVNEFSGPIFLKINLKAAWLTHWDRKLDAWTAALQTLIHMWLSPSSTSCGCWGCSRVGGIVG